MTHEERLQYLIQTGFTSGQIQIGPYVIAVDFSSEKDATAVVLVKKAKGGSFTLLDAELGVLAAEAAVDLSRVRDL